MGKNKKADYTEYATSICKTSWVNIFVANPNDVAELVKKGKDPSKYRRKCTFMFPKTVDSIDIDFSTVLKNGKPLNEAQIVKAKENIIAKGKEFLTLYRAAALKMALSVWDDCENKKDLEETEIRWSPILDGDNKKLVATYAGNAGYWLVRGGTGFDYAETSKMPFVYNSKNERVYEEGTLKSGDWVKGYVSLFTYGGKTQGVTAGMNNIKKMFTGEFTGVQTEEFDDDEDLQEKEATPADFADDKNLASEDDDQPWD